MTVWAKNVNVFYTIYLLAYTDVKTHIQMESAVFPQPKICPVLKVSISETFRKSFLFI